MSAPLSFIVAGLSITSSWGNGHATTYRSLLRGLAERGHDVLFLERDVPWYAAHRDLPRPRYAEVELYSSVSDLTRRFGPRIRRADAVIVGSYVPEGVRVGDWVVRNARGVAAFYDIDTPVTLAKLERKDEEYLSLPLVAGYPLYLSFTGGPVLDRIERELGSPCARPLYCSVDPSLYSPENRRRKWDLGYIGTYSADRQPALDRLLIEPARRWKKGRFVVAGPSYPADLRWPENVERIDHLAPPRHRAFYNAQKFTVNVTRAEMVRSGYSPSVRLFEAAACGVPVVSDSWPGIESFFEPGREILIARSSRAVLRALTTISESERNAIGVRARARVLAEHTGERRAAELETYVLEVSGSLPAARPQRPAALGCRTAARPLSGTFASGG